MLKKMMLWVIGFMTAQRFLGIAASLATGQQSLPTVVYAVSGAMVIYGLFLIFKSMKSDVSLQNLSMYYAMLALSVCANLVSIKMLSWVDATLLDFAVMGTVADLVLCAIMVGASLREKRYVRIRMKQTV